MSEIREHLGVPDNLRAIESKPQVEHDADGKKLQIRQYIKERNGQIIKIDDINKEYGWGQSTAQGHLRVLIKEGWVKRETAPQGPGAGVKYRYTTFDQRLPLEERQILKTRAASGKNNGPVVTHLDPVIVKRLEVNKKVQDIKNQIHNQTILNEQVNAMLFDYLAMLAKRTQMDATLGVSVLGFYTEAITGFSRELKRKVNKLEDQLKEELDGGGNDKADDLRSQDITSEAEEAKQD